MMEDREGNLWFATWGGGAACCDADSIRVVGLEPDRPVTCLARDDRGLWMGYWRSGDDNCRRASHYDGLTVEDFSDARGLQIEDSAPSASTAPAAYGAAATAAGSTWATGSGSSVVRSAVKTRV